MGLVGGYVSGLQSLCENWQFPQSVEFADSIPHNSLYETRVLTHTLQPSDSWRLDTLTQGRFDRDGPQMCVAYFG